nr:hypothetical protein [Candidatus Sigynarchaeota archaeon]
MTKITNQLKFPFGSPEPSLDGLIVDKTTYYRINAGQCTRCGHYKSWSLPITDPRTGHQMPGHVT